MGFSLNVCCIQRKRASCIQLVVFSCALWTWHQGCLCALHHDDAVLATLLITAITACEHTTTLATLKLVSPFLIKDAQK